MTTNTDTTAASGAASEAMSPAARKYLILGAAYEFRDAHLTGSRNLKSGAHAQLEAAIDNALAAPDAQEAEPAREHYDELLATLQGLHTFCENVSGMERRIGPLGSHARGYTHKITAAIRHLNAMAARRPQADAGAAPADVHAALCDSQYAAGMLLGWNLCVDGNEEQFRKIRGARMAGACEVARAQSAAAPQAPAAPTAEAADPVAAFWKSVEDGAVFDDISPETWRLIDQLVEQRKAAGDQAFLDEAPAPAAGAAPSDAEIADVSLEYVGQEPLSDFDYVAFARAVLARWGAAAPAKGLETEREAFEAWYRKTQGDRAMLWDQAYGDLTPETMKGKYILKEEQSAWAAWQAARRALAQEAEDAAPDAGASVPVPRNINRYCHAFGMCLASDKEHEADCPKFGVRARQEGGAA